MIYFDNAATTRPKPPEVARAVAEAIDGFGGVGRGTHEAALDADMAVFRTRRAVARLLGAPDPKRVVFTHNVTEALNVAIAGLVGPGDHAVTTAASHNSVLRPLFRAVDERDARVSVLPVAPDAGIDYGVFDALFEPGTRVAVVGHASNLTGDVYDVGRMARIAHAHGALLVVDAAQSAGVIPLNMAELGIDVLAFTGHKSLYGPQGTGGMCLAPQVDLPAYNEGGSGTHSYDRRQPAFYPEHLEAGTLNAHGLAGLEQGVAYIQRTGVDAIHAHLLDLVDRFERGLFELGARRVGAMAHDGETIGPNDAGAPAETSMDGDTRPIRIYGGRGGVDRCGVVAINVGDVPSAEVADILSSEFGICTRAGAHCAPLMHEALGTVEQGAVRFSFGSFNTPDEVDEALEALRAICGRLR